MKAAAGEVANGMAVNVLGVNPFTDTPKGIVYVGTEWMNNPLTSRSLTIKQLISPHFPQCDITAVVNVAINGVPVDEADKTYKVAGLKNNLRKIIRLRNLLDLLQVDIDWDISKLSQGQRRRVQFVLELLPEWDCLLIDETTMELDIAIRIKLFEYLRDVVTSSVAFKAASVNSGSTESVRAKTVIYTSHFMDYFILQSWCTHLELFAEGRIFWSGSIPRSGVKNNAEMNDEMEVYEKNLEQSMETDSILNYENVVKRLLKDQQNYYGVNNEKLTSDGLHNWRDASIISKHHDTIIHSISEQLSQSDDKYTESIKSSIETLWDTTIYPTYYKDRGALETLSLQNVLTNFLIQQEKLLSIKREQSQKELAPSLWEYLKNDMHHHGDKYYNYWN